MVPHNRIGAVAVLLAVSAVRVGVGLDRGRSSSSQRMFVASKGDGRDGVTIRVLLQVLSENAMMW